MAPVRAGGGRTALLAALAVGWTGACARQGVPPGGPVDVRPPVVVATVPEPFATVEDLTAPIRFAFNERISERVGGGSLADAVTMSPLGGEVRVSHGRRGLTVDVEGGLRPGVVYRVTLEPVVVDMFGNQLTDPFELVFTTGGEPVATTLAGEVWDRVTGRSVQAAKVYAIGADGLVHQATTSQEGIYALRYVAPGSFRVTAFQDQNRDQEIDSGEVQGSAPADLSLGDTLLLDIAVLLPDTIPAVLRRAAAADSVTVVLEFDDFLLPEAPVGELVVGLVREEGEAPGIAVLYHEADYAAHVEQVADSFARLDSIDRAEAGARAAATADSVAAANAAADPAGLDTAAAAGAAASPPPAAADSAGAVAGPPEAVRDTAGAGDDPARAAADTAGAAADPTAVEPGAVRENPPPITPGRPAPGRQVGGRAPPEPTAPGRRPPISLQALAGSRPGPVEGTDRVLPGRRIVALLDAPVEVEVEYTVTVAGVVNINGLGGGAGEAVFVLAAPEVDTTTLDDPLAPPDTGSAQPDTGGVAPDAGALVPDAGAVLPDTGAVLPDTGAVLPDTGAVLPDTGSVVPAAGTVAPVISSPVGRPRPGRSVPFERPRHQRPWTGPPTPR